MSTSCGSPFVNYFSNPDVTFLNKPTGTATEDNARAIGDNMVRNQIALVFLKRPSPSHNVIPKHLESNRCAKNSVCRVKLHLLYNNSNDEEKLPVL